MTVQRIEIATTIHGSQRVAGTEFSVTSHVYRRNLGGRKFEYDVVRRLCNGVPEDGETFKSKSAAMNFYFTGQRTSKARPEDELIYAVRLGFGTEGHGDAILVACGRTQKECEENAKRKLQDQFGGLWAGKYKDTFIGSVNWLQKNFPAQKGCKDVMDAIYQ